MAISVDQIDLWRTEPSETEVLEFKEAKGGFSYPKLLEYCVAIGNARGGHLILGVMDKIPRPVVGTSAIDNPVGMVQKIYDKLGFVVSIDVVRHPEGRVVVVSIPSRPVGSPLNLDGVFLMRVGESLQKMSQDQFRKIVMEGAPNWLEEPITDGYGQSRILELLDIPALFNAIGAREPSPAGQIDRLKQDRLIDEAGAGSYSIRRVGALLLAKDLRKFPDLEFKRPRVIVYPETSRIDPSIDDVHGQLGYSIGFVRLLAYIMRSLPHEEVTRNGLRKRIPLVPEIMVRELLANALVHQDFSIGGTAVRVEVFKNRLEVSNPGEPIVELNRLIDGVRSRNERLADLMRRFGICEERGSGIDKVVYAAESLHLTPPHFRVSEGRTIATVYGPKSFQEMDRADRIRACHQHCALKWEMSQPMTNQTLRARFQIPENKPYLVTQVIANTVEEKLIKLDTDAAGSSKKYARYVPAWV